MILKLAYFSMSKLMMLYFEPFWTPPFSFGHEKKSIEYVMDFEKKKDYYYT
jgi:hypothetical protein